MTKLETLKQEHDLRKAWKNEAKDFTPWLADNLYYIADILDMDLELVETESKVGTFSADILAKDSESERYVVIENQLDDSNHDHLGKLITYASGKDAKAIVWVVRKARDEHRQAIEWLNTHTISEIGFYLLEIELWTIGTSMPAPKFNVVERPNEWAKAVKPSSDISDSKMLQFQFWQVFVDYANKCGFNKTFSLRNPHARNWFDIAVGSSRCHISLEAKRQKQEATVGLYIQDDKYLFDSLFADKATIEADFGEPLEWTEASKARRIYAVRSFDLTDTSCWQDIFKWYIEKSIVIKKTVQKYL